MEIEELLLKINSGKRLKPGEIEEVAAFLEWVREDDKLAHRVSSEDLYAMLLVLGRARQPQFRQLLESFLEGRDALTVSLILETLCLSWGETEEFLERVLHFALGSSWDADDDVRHVSLKILGEYLFALHAETKGKLTVLTPLRRERASRVLRLLLFLFDDRTLTDFTRQAAYFALCRAAAKSWEEIPSECAVMDLSEAAAEVDELMITQLQELLALLSAP